MKKILLLLLLLFPTFAYADYTLSDLDLNCTRLINNSTESLYFEDQTNANGTYNFMNSWDTFTFSSPLTGNVSFRFFGSTWNLFFTHELDCSTPPPTWPSENDFEFDCWHIKNNSDITVDALIIDGFFVNIWTFLPWQEQIFNPVIQWYNPRITMIEAPFSFWNYPMDCRDWFRDPDPQWYTDYIASLNGGWTWSETPFDIQWFFNSEPPNVFNYDVPSFQIYLILNTGASLDPLDVQISLDGVISNDFIITSAVFLDNEPRYMLSIEMPNVMIDKCDIYDIKIPASSLTSGLNTNWNWINWYFTIEWCPNIEPPVDSWSTNTGVTFSNTGATYISLYEVHNWVYYFNLWAVFYFFVLLSIVISIFFGLFKYFLNFMIWKK